jgi:hypothetical protein
MFFHQQQQDVALGLQVEAEEGLLFLRALAARLADDGGAGGARGPRRLQHLRRLGALDECDDELEMHPQVSSLLAFRA